MVQRASAEEGGIQVISFFVSLSNEARSAIKRHLQKNQPGTHWGDDQGIVLAITHMLKCGGHEAHGPQEHPPAMTACNS